MAGYICLYISSHQNIELRLRGCDTKFMVIALHWGGKNPNNDTVGRQRTYGPFETSVGYDVCYTVIARHYFRYFVLTPGAGSRLRPPPPQRL